MCAIVDAHIVKGLLKKESTPGEFFWKQVESRKITIVVGGYKLKDEYEKASCSQWLAEAIRAGLVRSEEDQIVENLAERLASDGRITSDDHHIIALAQISGARLLYSYDKKLHTDFKSKSLIDRPRGKIYATGHEEALRDKHRRLLRQTLCKG